MSVSLWLCFRHSVSCCWCLSASIYFSCAIHWLWSSCIFCQSASDTFTDTFNLVGASSMTWSTCSLVESTFLLMVFTAAPSSPSSRWVWRIEDSKDSLALMTAVVALSMSALNCLSSGTRTSTELIVDKCKTHNRGRTRQHKACKRISKYAKQI